MALDDETIDVMICGYLSKDSAHDDYQAALDSGGYLHGAVVVSKDLEGNLAVEQTDHMVREGAAGLGAVGFAVGLFAPPLLAATAVGAAVGAAAGKGRTTAPRTSWRNRQAKPSRSAAPG
jgi:arylsulfatase